MKKTLLTMLLAAATAATWAGKKDVVWERPTFISIPSGTMEVTQMELREDETVMHLTVRYRPHMWIRFAKECVLRTPDGTTYAITGGKATRTGESDLSLGEEFWMPDEGKADIALHFKPLPANTQMVDFTEGDFQGAYHLYNIADPKHKHKTAWPKEWKGIRYEKNEQLDETHISLGTTATVKATVLGFHAGMDLTFGVEGYRPLGATEEVNKTVKPDADGKATLELPVEMVRTLTVGIRDVGYATCFVAPGQTTECLIDLNQTDQPFVAFKGFMAKTNLQLADQQAALDAKEKLRRIYDTLNPCTTPEQRAAVLRTIKDEYIREANNSKLTDAMKAVMRTRAESEYMKFRMSFGYGWAFLLNHLGMITYNTPDEYQAQWKEYAEMLPMMTRDEFCEEASAFEMLTAPYAPSLPYFEDNKWYYSMMDDPVHRLGHDLLGATIITSGRKPDREAFGRFIDGIADPVCLQVVADYEARQKRLDEELKRQTGVFYKTYDDVAPEQILDTIVSKYKGKRVLIDIWATWCGPCKRGHEVMKPYKEEVAGSDIAFVYLTGPSSPLETWQQMIGNISGDHYYLTQEQYDHILRQYESTGIPTYLFFDRDGHPAGHIIGFPGLEEIKKKLLSVEC